MRDSDLIVAIFWTRLGAKTPRADSGTVEEISEHAKAAIAWTRAIQELLSGGFCRDLNGKRQIYELTQNGFDFLGRALRDRFNNGTDVYVRAKTRKSPANLFSSRSEKLLDCIVRMPRTLVEREGIEWNCDYILRDLAFQRQILTKVSEIETSLLGGGGLQAPTYNIESLEFYEGDPKSLPDKYRQMGSGCLI